jgi:hypothetical protein
LSALFALTGCGHQKPADAPENSDETASSDEPTKDTAKSASEPDPVAADPTSSSALDTTGVANASAAEKATIRDDTEKEAMPCSGMNIPNLLASISQATCEVSGAAAARKTRATKDVLDVVVTPDSPKVAPGSTATISVVFTNKGRTKLPLDFTVDPDPRFTFEVYTPKGVRVDKPVGKEPALPAAMDDAPATDSRTARVVLDPRGKAKLVLPWQAVRYKWAPKEKAKGALPGRGYPREPAGPLPRGKYVLRVITPLANVDDGADHELSHPRMSIEIAGNPEAAQPPPAALPKANPEPAAAAPAASSDESVESKFLKTVGAASTPAAPARPPAKKH